MQQQKTQNTRMKIMDAAGILFIERGYHDVSIKDVQHASGVSNGSIFHHFGSKDGIALQLYLEEREYYWSIAIEAMEMAGDDPKIAVAAAISALLDYQTENPRKHSFMIECASAEWMSLHANEVIKLNNKFGQRFIQWVAPHLQSGAVKNMPPELFASIIFGPAQWLARGWTTQLTTQKPTAYKEDLIQMVIRALDIGNNF